MKAAALALVVIAVFCLAVAIGWKHDDVQAAYDKAGELLRRHEA